MGLCRAQSDEQAHLGHLTSHVRHATARSLHNTQAQTWSASRKQQSCRRASWA